MYYPYLRGKQNELILLRENAELISKSKILPIIEPVKANLNPLIKSLTALIEADCEFTLIINPTCGDHENNNDELITRLTSEKIFDYPQLNTALICDENITIEQIKDYLDKYTELRITIIHYGFSDAKALIELLSKYTNVQTQIFIEELAQKRYRKAFSDYARVLIRDGFKKRSNKEHPPLEHFSELHIMYVDEGMQGFGDFLINGDEYSESGGPAYAVAIHLTYLDNDDDDDMFIKHYISDSNSSPADPGGKFLEALTKLTNDTDPKIFNSNATREFKKLAERQHFPGLGSVKKLSIQHHIELIADFLK
jgi:hypothetical protein